MMAHFVLIHGGFCGGWYWKKVKLILEHAGHTVYTPTLTGLGESCHLNGPHINLDTHIRDVRNVLFFENIKNAILVGHSYGGLVITGVASTSASRMGHLIYLDALIPDRGDSLMSLVDEQTAYLFTTQVNEKGNGWFVPPPKNIQLINKDDSSWFSERLTPQSFNSFTQPIFFNAEIVDRIKTSFVFCTQNTHQTIKNMSVKARSKKWAYFEIESDHFPMIDIPEKFSLLLQEIK